MISRILRRKMSQNVFNKLATNAEIADTKLNELKHKLQEVRTIKIQEKVRELTQENAVLFEKVQKAKAELIRLETKNGKKQIPIPGILACTSNTVLAETPIKTDNIEPAPKKEKKEKEPKKSKEKVNAAATVESEIDVRKLDFRIGKIVDIKKHPDADSLYVEKIECGEENPRTVVSGLVNHVPIEEMQNRIVMVLCNLKPVKMRGVTSEAMVMCASSPEKIEVLVPPNGAVPGDVVVCEGFPREPEPILNPKKKIFETCAPDLKTDRNKVACYKDSPLVVQGKGPVVAPTLKGVQVK